MILQDIAKLRLTDPKKLPMFSNEYTLRITAVVGQGTSAAVIEANKIIEREIESGHVDFYPNPIYTHPLFGVL